MNCKECGAKLFRGRCPRCDGCYICGDDHMELTSDGSEWVCPTCGWRCDEWVCPTCGWRCDAR